MHLLRQFLRFTCVSVLIIFIGAAVSLRVAGASINPVITIRWSPDGSKVAFGYARGGVTVINASTKQVDWQIDTTSLFSESVDWHPNSRLLAVGGGLAEMHIFDVQTQQEIKALPDVGETVYSVRWNPSGTKLAIIYQNGTGPSGEYGIKIFGDWTKKAMQTAGLAQPAREWVILSYTQQETHAYDNRSASRISPERL